MASHKWDAYSSLDITSGDKYRITCVGTNRFGGRCGWEFRGRYYNDICALLNEMEKRPPMEAIKSLRELARLSLCQDWHQNQAYTVVGRWESAIMEVAEEYERRKIHVQAGLGEPQAEIERLGVQLANEQANSTSVTNQLRTTQQRYEDQEKRTEEYHRAFVESERKVGDLGEKLYSLSIGYQESLSQKAQTVERTTAERDNLRAELVTLESQLSQLNERSIHKDQEIDRVTTERVNLSMQVENLTEELDLESEASNKYQSDLLQTQTHRDTLAKEVDGLRSQLDMEQKKSSGLVLDLEKAETLCTTLRNEKRGIKSRLKSECKKCEELTAKLSQLETDRANEAEARLESECQKCEELTAELSQLETDRANEAEALQIELASTSARLHQELNTTKEDLSTIRSHPFKTFSTTLISIFKRRVKAVTKFKRNMRSSKGSLVQMPRS